MSKGFIRTNESRGLDENGQLQSSTTQKEGVYKTQEDEFYMVFIKFVKGMYGIKSVTALKLLCRFLEIAQFNTGEISISSGLRDQLTTELDISSSMFSKAVKELVENKALYPKMITIKQNNEEIKKISKNEYVVNPDMFGKGDLRKRKELRITFSSEEENLDKQKIVEAFEQSKEF